MKINEKNIELLLFHFLAIPRKPGGSFPREVLKTKVRQCGHPWFDRRCSPWSTAAVDAQVFAQRVLSCLTLVLLCIFPLTSA